VLPTETLSAKREIFSCQRKSYKKKSKKSSSKRETSLINFKLTAAEVIRPFPGGEMDLHFESEMDKDRELSDRSEK